MATGPSPGDNHQGGPPPPSLEIWMDSKLICPRDKVQGESPMKRAGPEGGFQLTQERGRLNVATPREQGLPGGCAFQATRMWPVHPEQASSIWQP